MCGIVGYVGKSIQLKDFVSMLEKLEYRGYDSSGVCYLEDGVSKIVKEKGKISNLKEKLDLEKEINVGISHTRWATHGEANEVNAHPHKSGKFTVVHNGIIENYLELKEKLVDVGYSFLSETDTEVISAYLDYLSKSIDNIPEILRTFQQDIVGSYAILMMVDSDPDSIWVVKKNSPLIVSKCEDKIFASSDLYAILDHTRIYYVLEDFESAKLNRKTGITFYDASCDIIEKEVHTFTETFIDTKLGNYKHYMLKEIEEEPEVISHLFDYYASNDFEKLKQSIPDFSKYSRIFVVGCGTAIYAGLVFKNLCEVYLEKEVTVVVASEFRYMPLFIDDKTLVIAISQSGETADTLRAIEIAKNVGVDTFSIVNVVDSSIARSSDYVLYTRCGIEVSVASTKAYVAQIYLLSLIICYLKDIPVDRSLSSKMDKVLSQNFSSKIAWNLKPKEHVFFLGRGIDYVHSLEGALKLKEVSYIHAEGYASGEMKHGTISLIDEDTYVIATITEEKLVEKEISNLMEVKSRGAKVVLFIKKSLNRGFDFDYIYELEDAHPLFMPILAILPLQLLAYYTAKFRGCEIDKPKNLAKSVTVE